MTFICELKLDGNHSMYIINPFLSSILSMLCLLAARCMKELVVPAMDTNISVLILNLENTK